MALRSWRPKLGFAVWLCALSESVTAQQCAGSTDFGIVYEGVSAFSVSAANYTCACRGRVTGAAADIAGPLSASGKVLFGDSLQAQRGFVYVPDVADYVSVLPFRKGLYSYPYVKITNVANGTARNFPSPSVMSLNEWDWPASDPWITCSPPSPYSPTATVYAHVSMSIYNPSHHQMCMYLRREYFNASTSTWEKLAGDPDIFLNCPPIGRRKLYPASWSRWVPWWSENLPRVASVNGQPTQRLLVSGESSYTPDPPARFGTVIYGWSVELYASESGLAQQFSFGGTPSGAPIPDGLVTSSSAPVQNNTNGLGDNCFVNIDCGPGLVCVTSGVATPYRCLLATGGSCSSTLQCASGTLCLNNVCVARTCKSLLDSGIGTTSGTYSLDLDGYWGRPAFNAWCDQVNDGGGWMVVSWPMVSNVYMWNAAQSQSTDGTTGGLAVTFSAQISGCNPNNVAYFLIDDWNATTPWTRIRYDSEFTGGMQCWGVFGHTSFCTIGGGSGSTNCDLGVIPFVAGTDLIRNQVSMGGTLGANFDGGLSRCDNVGENFWGSSNAGSAPHRAQVILRRSARPGFSGLGGGCTCGNAGSTWKFSNVYVR